MSIGSFILALAFIVGIGMIVAWPLITKAQDKHLSKRDQTPLQTQYEAVVMSLRDLDFDYQTGKLLEADYQLQRERLMQLGADLLRRLDEQGASLPTAPTTPQQSPKA
jgi:hypothetical protein